MKKAPCKKKCCGKKNAAKKKKEEDAKKFGLKKSYTKEEMISWAKAALALAIFTIVYNVGEGVVAIYYGMEEESIALLGFGLDSFVEVFSAIIVLIQLIMKEKIMDGKGN